MKVLVATLTTEYHKFATVFFWPTYTTPEHLRTTCTLAPMASSIYFHVSKIKTMDWTLDSQSKFGRKKFVINLIVKNSTLYIHIFENFSFIQFYYDQILVMDPQYFYKSTNRLYWSSQFTVKPVEKLKVKENKPSLITLLSKCCSFAFDNSNKEFKQAMFWWQVAIRILHVFS